MPFNTKLYHCRVLMLLAWSPHSKRAGQAGFSVEVLACLSCGGFFSGCSSNSSQKWRLSKLENDPEMLMFLRVCVRTGLAMQKHENLAILQKKPEYIMFNDLIFFYIQCQHVKFSLSSIICAYILWLSVHY